MKKNTFILFLCVTVFLVPLVQAQESGVFKQEGIASWYGKEFDGRPTASGEIFDSSQLTAAHPNLPFGTMLVVTNRHNNKKVTVRVNDRGPFVAARIVDISRAAAEQLDMIVTGTAPVIIESVSGVAVLPPSEPVKVSPPVPQPQPAQPIAPALVQPVQPPPVQSAQPIYTPAVVQPVYTPTVVQPIEAPPSIPTPPVYAPVIQPVVSNNIQTTPADVYVPTPSIPSQPVSISVPSFTQAVLIPAVNPIPGKMYRLQVGSYKVARNAVEAFDKLKTAGLSPAYEQNDEYFRVVLAGVSGYDVQSILERLGSAGFREALIREER